MSSKNCKSNLSELHSNSDNMASKNYKSNISEALRSSDSLGPRNYKTNLSEFKTHSDKDTLSEASESGTGTSNSITSAEDLQKLAVILGLNSAEDVYQERFRVDRRRLEAMLAEHLDESQKAQAFFHQVMTETNTLVNWPARLKIGARSKKENTFVDPEGIFIPYFDPVVFEFMRYTQK